MSFCWVPSHVVVLGNKKALKTDNQATTTKIVSRSYLPLQLQNESDTSTEFYTIFQKEISNVLAGILEGGRLRN